jgi:hypothetical protein
VLAQLFDFKPGQLVLYERSKLYNEIVRHRTHAHESTRTHVHARARAHAQVQHHMDNHEYAQIIEACKRLGEAAARPPAHPPTRAQPRARSDCMRQSRWRASGLPPGRHASAARLLGGPLLDGGDGCA